MIQLFHVSKTYLPNYRALTDITLGVKSGEFVFLGGPSGAGKSTLLKLLFREEEPSEGQILIDGKNVTRLSSHKWLGFDASSGWFSKRSNFCRI
jgi:cell division transport system ATP-binding protein